MGGALVAALNTNRNIAAKLNSVKAIEARAGEISNQSLQVGSRYGDGGVLEIALDRVEYSVDELSGFEG